MPSADVRTDILRHLVATIAYRATVALRGFPDDASERVLVAQARTPVALLAHLADLMQWSALIVRGEGRPRRAPEAPWAATAARFYAGLEELDAALAAGASPTLDVDALLHGPMADALTHVGQLLLLRRLAGAPAQPQRYLSADVRTGLVGPEQPGVV